MNIAICDDEITIREQIKNLIEKQELNYTLKIFSSGQELIEAKLQFDIIFLDIQMEGINGIEAARKLRERGEEAILIFITGLKEYVFDAFDVSAFHYLLKPVEEEKFHRVFYRALEELKKREQQKYEKNQKQEQFFVKTRMRNYIINKNDILFIENRGTGETVYLAKGKYSEFVKVYMRYLKSKGVCLG